MATFDLNNLPHDVLTFSNEIFYNFVLQVCGEVEAEILQTQGIRNVRSLLRSTNVLSILELDCEEVNVLKPNACFKCKSGEYVVKQVSSIQTTSTNIDDNNNSTVPNPPGAITTSSSSAITLLTSSAKNANASSSKYKSVHDHVVFIKDLIEKFSRKTFTSTILKDGEHYHLSITNTEQTFKAIIKCKCGTKIFLPSRSDTSTFILSNFYAHLTASTCSSVKEIVEEEKAEAEIQAILTPSVQASTTNSNNENSISSNRSKRKHIYESLPTTNSSSTKKRKR